jgi:Ca-activated chloride channel family protein
MSPHSSYRSARGRQPGSGPGGLALLAVVVLGLAAGLGLRAQGAPDRQRAMYVTVTDQNGAPVSGLTPDDFIVREDGVQREVLRVEPATGPIEITLVVDTSDVASPYIADMRRALTGFVKDMAKGNEIALTSFGGRPQVVQGYTTSVELLNRAIGRVFAEQGTGAYLLEALASVARGVTKRAPDRAVIVAILTQAAPEFSNEPRENLVKALRDSGAAFDAVTLQSGAGTVPPAGSEQATARHDRDVVLDEATRATGGISDQLLSGMALTPELTSIAAQLRSQYRLVYARPGSLIPPEKIVVSAKKPGLNARGTPVRVQAR